MAFRTSFLPGTVLSVAGTQSCSKPPLNTAVNVPPEPTLAQKRAVPESKATLSQKRKSEDVANFVLSAPKMREVSKRADAVNFETDTLRPFEDNWALVNVQVEPWRQSRKIEPE